MIITTNTYRLRCKASLKGEASWEVHTHSLGLHLPLSPGQHPGSWLKCCFSSHRLLPSFTDTHFFFKKLFYCSSITVVCISPPLLSPTPATPPPSLASTLPLGFVHVTFIVVPENPYPHWPLPSGYCQIVLTFSVSGSILLTCFFC